MPVSDKPELYCVAPKDVALTWPLVSHYIARAHARVDIGRFGYTQADVLAGKSLLWVLVHQSEIIGAGISQIQDTDRRKVCVILAYGGKKPHDWTETFKKVEEYARWMGCESMRIWGRKGWARVMREYKLSYVILEKKL